MVQPLSVVRRPVMSPPRQFPPPEFLPPMFPPPEFPPRQPRIFSRTPPAVFPVLLGLLGLGLALRRALAELDLPGGAADLLLGAAGALWLFALLAYCVKLARRPAVLAEDLRVLPGRGGVAAGTVGGMGMAATLTPFAPRLAGAVLVLALAAHVFQAVVLIAVLHGLPDVARRTNPSLHLTFAGPLLGGVAAVGLGWSGVAVAVFWAMLPVVLLIWTLSALQFTREVPPAPLRPMLAIHLAPASLLASIAALTGQTGIAAVLALLGGIYLVVLLVSARWVAVSGFSAMWGSFTFPLTAYAGALLLLGWMWPAVIVLILALGLVPWIAFNIIRMWATGSLAQKTNAATA